MLLDENIAGNHMFHNGLRGVWRSRKTIFSFYILSSKNFCFQCENMPEVPKLYPVASTTFPVDFATISRISSRRFNFYFVTDCSHFHDKSHHYHDKSKHYQQILGILTVHKLVTHEMLQILDSGTLCGAAPVLVALRRGTRPPHRVAQSPLPPLPPRGDWG